MPQRLSVEKEYHRLLLYRKGATDGEIAREVGIRRQVITRWRQGKGLPRPKTTARKKPEKAAQGGAPMEKALSHEQCLVMKRFLHDLVQTHKTAKEKGLEAPSITAFMRTWRQIHKNCSRTKKERFPM